MKKIIGLIIVIGIIGLAGYEALMYYDNNFRYGRMRETPAVRPYEEPLLKMEAGLVPIDGGEAVYQSRDLVIGDLWIGNEDGLVTAQLVSSWISSPARGFIS